MNFEVPGLTVEGDFPLGKLLSSLLAQTEMGRETTEYAGVVCPTCGTSYQEFISESKFGCPDCYKVFGLLIDENIRNLQGNDTHKGKHPKYLSDAVTDAVRDDLTDGFRESVSEPDPAAQISAMKHQLKQAIAREEFEEAARLRDEIKALEGGETNA